MERLEEIVRAMERGDAPLDESLKLFREGTALIGSCSKMLEEAELLIKMVTADSAGNPTEEIMPNEF